MHSQDIHLSDIIGVIEKFAPPGLAEAWDNCGLQVGSHNGVVKKIWVALDPLLPVIESAAEREVDLVITHHPLVFQPLKQVDFDTAIGKTIHTAIQGNVAIYAAHTNLDSASEGINDILADKIGMQNLRPLVPAKSASYAIDEGVDVTKLGLGRIGSMPSPVSVKALVEHTKKCLGIEHVRVAGNPEAKVRQIAVCSGAGSSLVEVFLESDAQVFISGDLKYHDARNVEAAGKSVIDVGHFASEHIIIDVLVHKLQQVIKATEWPVQVEACRLERDPFKQL